VKGISQPKLNILFILLSPECEAGYYGENCKNFCNQCLDEECDRFDGLCQKNCAAGYKGFPKCYERRVSFVI
jgi:hypothetical protein